MDVVGKDLPTTAAFYRHVFGWDLSESLDHHGGDYQMLVRDGFFLAGAEQIGAEKGDARWTVFTVTDDLSALIAAVLAAGGAVTFASQPLADLGVVAMITDPLGATIGVWEPGTFDPREIPPLDGRFHGAELVTTDPAVTSAFLTGVLGWTSEGPHEGVERFVSGGRIATVSEGVQGEWRPVLAVESLERSAEAVRLAGGTAQSARQDGIVEAADSQGAEFLLVESRR